MKIIMNEWQFNRLTEAMKMLEENISKEEVDMKAAEADTNPSDAQKEAGNYKMGHVRIKGFDITIENPVGSKRYYGKDKKKFNIMKNHYGYFTKTKGKDGDQVDVFIGPNPENFEKVYVVDQKMNGSFDESKVMFGFNDKKEAKAAYFSNFNSDWHGFMHITGVSLAVFKKWLYRGRKQRQPFADYAMIQKKKVNESMMREIGSEYREEDDLAWKPVRDGAGHANLESKITGELLYSGEPPLTFCGYMDHGIAVVRNEDRKYNYLTKDGTLLLDDWYDDAEEFRGDRGRIVYDEVVDGKLHTFCNYVDREGNILGDWEMVR